MRWGIAAACAVALVCSSPAARAAPSPRPTLLVAEGNDALLASVSTSTGVVENRIPTGRAPTAVAVSGRFAFVADYRSAAVTRVDLVTGTARTFEVGPDPAALATMGGSLYVAEPGAAVVAALDVASGRTEWKASVPAGPVALAADPSTSSVWVLSSAAGDLTRIDAATGRVAAPIPVGVLPQGIAVSGGGGTAYVTVQSRLAGAYNDGFPIGGGSSPADGLVDDGSLETVNLTSGRVERAVKVGLDPEGVALDAGTAFVANAGDATVTPVDVATGLAGAPIAVGDGPQQLVVDRADGIVYVSDAGNGTVARIAVAGRRLLPAMRTGGEPTGLALAGHLPAARRPPLVCEHISHGPTLGALTAVQPDPSLQRPQPWRIFVADAGGDTVTEVDVATGRPLSEIPVGNKPSAVAVTPDGRTALVADFSDNAVTPIDTATGMAGPLIPVGANPNAIAVTPNGTEALVTDYGGNAVTPIDLVTGKPLPSLPVGGGPSSIAVTPDGAMAYLVDSDTDAVTPIDVVTSTVWSQIPVGYNPQGIAIGSDGRTAWVTNAGYLRNADSGSVTPVDTRTGRTGPAIAVGRYPVYPVVPVPGATVYVPNSNSNTVTAIDTATGRAEGAVAAGNGPDALGASPDGATVYAVDLLGSGTFPSGALTPIDTATRKAGPAIPVGYGPIAIGVTPADGYFAVTASGALNGFGSAGRLGGQAPPGSGVVAAAADSDSGGVWLLGSDGAVTGWDAPTFGGVQSLVAGGEHPAGIAALDGGAGYRIAMSSGAVATVGPAGTTVVGGTSNPGRSPVVAIATDTCTGGYWLLHGDGTVTGSGAPLYGNPLGVRAVAIAGAQDGRGYWIATAGGRVLGYGSAAGAADLAEPLVAVATGPATGGYWALTAGGKVIGVGTPNYPGSAAGAVALVPGPDSTPR